MVRSKLFFLVSIFISTLSFGQDRYMVFFTDKSDSPYSVDKPEEFLSSAAISRNGRADISEQDLPVNPSYVSGLKQKGVDVKFTTKWFNAALVESDKSTLSSLGLNYVSSYEKVASGNMPSASGRSDYSKDDEEGEGAEQTFKQNNILGIEKMHEEGYNGSGVRIAVLDAGFENIDSNPYLKHAFDEGRVSMTYDFVRDTEYVYGSESYHGAKVFSIFGSYIEGSYVGGGYGATFDLFISEETGAENRIEEYNWVIAAEKADSAGVDIITTSLGYYTFDDSSKDYKQSQLDGQTAIITQAAEIAFNKGILVITSAGNEGRTSSEWHDITFPADGENILAVGGLLEINEPNRKEFVRAEFSSFGPTVDGRIKPEVMAIGENTTLINASGEISSGNGTSYAAPLITGMAAGIWQRYPELTNLELRELIIESGDNYDDPNNEYGYGVPSYTRARNIMEGIETGTIDDEKLDFRVYPNPVTIGNQLHFQLNEMQSIEKVVVYDLHGKQVIEKTSKNLSEVNTSRLQKGIYRLQVYSHLGNIFQTSFLVY